MNSEAVVGHDPARDPAGEAAGEILQAPGRRGRRVLFLGLVLGTVAPAAFLMTRILPTTGMGPLLWVIFALFLCTFTWIAISFWTAAAGFVLRLLRRDPLSLRPVPAGAVSAGPVRLAGRRTAIVIPICNEDPARVMQGAEAICHSLLATGQAAAFDLFLLSDSNDPDVIPEEERTVWALQGRLPAPCRTHYRRRPVNSGRKAGNIAEFCQRWGGRYDYMIVLDADSVMEGPTLVQLVRLMDANPDAGLIQTMPLPVRQESLFGRFQQFASALHGPMLATGLSFWQGSAGNYWGHNAIIRVRPFVEHCELPVLSGRPPLGGEILSHDFVEAALLRRGGWDVWLLPDLSGSYEELPGNLVDYARRDRRWSQGNLQHLRLLSTAGLHPVSRLHLLFGALAYLASLFWLLMLGTASAAAVVAYQLQAPGMASAAQHGSIPVYAPLAYLLLAVTVVLLLLPKLFGVALALRREPERFGGPARLVLGGLLETLYSVLIAPLMMAFHSLFVGAVVLGRNVSWTSQSREGRMVSWHESWQRTRPFVLGGLVWGAAVAWGAPGFFWWLSPVFSGLLLSPLLVRVSGSQRAGYWLRERNLLLAPSELAPSAALAVLGRLESCAVAAPERTGSGDAAGAPVAWLQDRRARRAGTRDRVRNRRGLGSESGWEDACNDA
ncbi:glucans biosynthesis glucosyltransferase MdoH [Thioalkalivibrio sp.]|uniref:glucans biosynthesis glucosyltransferase MdoH n=1 Tax=Thioalkalivibrio sp. TaxID=2093813 RepID=UPI0035634A7B